MPLAAKHLDMIIGVDIHLVNIPPATGVPMPHPFIGIIFDPFDYLPFIGCNTYVNKQKCATSATGAMLGTKVHIPMGAGFTMAPTIAHDGAMFFGSSTVKAEGSNMSAGPYMIMTCSCIGMPLSVTFGKKPKQMKPSMYLPTSTSLPIPKGMPVNVNGPLVPDIYGSHDTAGNERRTKLSREICHT